MKSILSIISFFASVAFAGPVPLEQGTYSFKRYEVVQKKHIENVYSANDEGKKRLKELQSQKYNCQHMVNQIYQCSAFVPFAGTENEVARIVQESAGKSKVEFAAPTGDAYLDSEGDALKEYIVPQTAIFDGSFFTNYRYVVRSNSESLFFGRPAKFTFVIDPRGQIFYSLPLTLKKTTNSVYKYLVLVQFSKN